jgi:hypothetical protein
MIEAAVTIAATHQWLPGRTIPVIAVRAVQAVDPSTQNYLFVAYKIFPRELQGQSGNKRYQITQGKGDASILEGYHSFDSSNHKWFTLRLSLSST